MYPAILKNSTLHYFDDHSILLTDKDNYILNDVETYIIEKFNGHKSISEILEEIGKDLNTYNYSKIESVVMDFINNKSDFLVLNKTSQDMHVKTSGIKNAKVPINIIISLTNKCNLKCIHCFKNCSYQNNNHIPYETLIDALDFLKNKSISIQLTGGEPMLYDNFFNILNYCIDNFRTTVTTTGTLINEKNIKNFKGVNSVQLSLYSHDKNIHDSITRTPGSFRKTILAIKALSNMKIPLIIATIVTKSNINYIEDLIDTAYKCGANSIRFGTLIPYGRGTSLNSWILSEEETKYVELQLEKLSEKYKNKINVITWHKKKSNININSKYKALGCGGGLLSWCISETGIVKPCEFLEDTVHPIGNIKKTEIKDLIWKCNFQKMPEHLIKFEKELNKENTSVKNMCEEIQEYYLKYCSDNKVR